MNNQDNIIYKFLKNSGNIAVVGATDKISRAGYFVPKYMQSIGFNIIPINPYKNELFGVKSLNDINELNTDVSGIIIYRKRDEAEKIAFHAIDIGIPLVWLPTGITSDKAMKYAINNNIILIQNRCPLVEGRRLLG